jgi:nitrite reductase/ring-hydroxylating ferredoxin subunit/catechol 2,3-dioxygenase-like lactoylglutathione lyase family enzyme
MMNQTIDTIDFSHGTVECRDLDATRRFYREFLGLRCVRMEKMAQYVWLGGEWILACIAVGDAKMPRGIENRFTLQMGSADEVDAAHAAATRQREAWKIQDIRPIEHIGPERSFCLQDLDSNWWEISHRSKRPHDELFPRKGADAARASTRLVPVCAVDEIEQGSVKRIEVENRVLALYRIDGRFYATDAMCTHEEFDLAADGELIGDIIECPAHFGRFHVPTGKAAAHPCIEPLKTYDVTVADGRVYVGLD